MTREQNAKRQREFQEKRKARNAAAFKWIMNKMRSEKGCRKIKTGLRKVLDRQDATPAQIIRAAELLLFIETGERKVNGKDLMHPVKVQPPSADPGMPPRGPDITPNDDDPSMIDLMQRMSQD
jgi:hypothetical protein